jgi:hypothetical protein
MLLGFLTLLAIGSFAASAAYGEAGPFWHHRAIGGEGEGSKIEEKTPEEVYGGGGEQKLSGKIGTEPVEITAAQIQIKGHIWNNPLQGQAKLQIQYHTLALAKPALPGCVVKVGQNNILEIQFHTMWKWDGTASQLEKVKQEGQVFDGLLYHFEIQEGQEKPSEAAEFTSVTLSGTSCGVLAGTYKTTGFIATAFEKTTLGEFNKSIGLKVENGSGLQQHYWDGTRFRGITTVLKFGPNTSTYNGASKVADVSNQEIALFEK